MRITGGKARGIGLQSPRGNNTRPATDVVREALFSSLGSTIQGVRFVDLFAGTGAYGLEAWSRGAANGCFVEKDKNCNRCIKENILSVSKSAVLDADLLTCFQVDVFKWRTFERHTYNLVFADPPYAIIETIETELFKLARELLNLGGLFIVEKPARLEFSPIGWTKLKSLGKKRGNGPSLEIWQRESMDDVAS